MEMGGEAMTTDHHRCKSLWGKAGENSQRCTHTHTIQLGRRKHGEMKTHVGGGKDTQSEVRIIHHHPSS